MTPSHQLDLRSRHPNFQEYLAINENESDRVRKEYHCHLNVKYGEAPLQNLDIFPSSSPNSPILIFIHGGYWKALDKSSYSFVAEPFIQKNITVCIINYRLIPDVTMEGVLSDISSCIYWIQKNADKYHGDPKSLVLSGHSAGGHLALMAYLINNDIRSNILGICSLSGLFDLAPIKNSYLNDILQLDDRSVQQFSPTTKELTQLKCPVFLTVGAGETDLFIEQSKRLYQENKSASPLEYFEYPQLNHYEIVHKLGELDNPIVDFIFDRFKAK
ncbi:alpha/beta hydrolase [Flammeovirga sp. SubArs3]|uniref:alpha/beta hydrolase n=1 Tax=Flammeovirga sp. SubArs3 TaxID=2995316 RepID=UPI00248B2FC6|nr:alpha/beta hydrolase [Flammeovirga sp. SubArs3]